MCSQKEIQAALSLNPIAEGAQEFYLTEYAIKVSKILRIPCYFYPCCSKIGLNLIRTFTLNGSNSGDSRVKFLRAIPEIYCSFLLLYTYYAEYNCY